MKVTIVGSAGLHASETKAVAAMEKTLRDSWFAYAGIVLVDEQGPMEVDTLIITHDRILVVELKEWNGLLESNDGVWIQNKRKRHNSPLQIKTIHGYRIRDMLKNALKHKIGYFPHVETHVVLCGTATPENLTASERERTHTLEQFLKIRTEDGYNNIVAHNKVAHLFNNGTWSRPNSDKVLPEIKEFFSGPEVSPMEYRFQGYVADQTPWWAHRHELYREYKATHIENPKLKGLLRRWDLYKLGTERATTEDWSLVVRREDKVLQHIKAESPKLLDYILLPSSPLTEDDVSNDVTQLYELKPTYSRLDEYIIRNAAQLSESARIDLVRALITPFAEFHGLYLGHRDIDTHTLWYSNDQKSIVVSSFATAHFDEKGTLKDLRSLLQSSNIKLPEDQLLSDSDIKDPFRIDVFLLGLVCIKILYAPQLANSITPLEYDDEIAVWKGFADLEDNSLADLDDWLAKCLNWEQSERFTNAGEMLSEFNLLTAADIASNDDSQEVFNALMSGDFLKEDLHAMIFFSKYPPHDGAFPTFGGDKVRYKARIDESILLCKIWPNVQIGIDLPGPNRRLLQFRNRIEAIKDSQLPAPPIHSYGVMSGGGLFVVTKYVNGVEWPELISEDLSRDDRLSLSGSLVEAVMKLHRCGISHGDLHANNILVCREESEEGEYCYQVTLLDMLDFGASKEPCNTEYGPKNPAHADAFGRDRYGTYKLIEELFVDNAPKAIADELKRGWGCPDGIPVTLESLHDAICAPDEPETSESEQAESEDAYLVISEKSKFWPAERVRMQPDGQGYYFNSKWISDDIACFITGINEQLSVRLNPETRRINSMRFTENISVQEVVSAGRKSSATITQPIAVQYGDASTASEQQLVNLILSLPPVLDLLAEKYSTNEEIVEARNDLPVTGIEVKTLWSALADTEQDLLLQLQVESGEIDEDSHGYLRIPYSEPQGQSLNFEDDDQVFVYLGEDDNQIGDLSVENTTVNHLYLKTTQPYIRKRLKPGTILRLESLKSKSSRDRRSRALNRILENSAVIPEIWKYFDPIKAPRPIELLPTPLEEDFRRLYDTDHEKANEQQVRAFQQIVSKGPVGVLQGPPGTGKTKFISKLIHYLYDNTDASSILLVGQSHTSVDNVAIKAQEVCSSKELDIGIVRIGSESMIDEQLLPSHPSSLQRQIRNKFHREYDLRINALNKQILLPQPLVEQLTSLHRTVSPLLNTHRHVSELLFRERNRADSGQVKSERVYELEVKKTKSAERIATIINRVFDGEIQIDLDSKNLWEDLVKSVAHRHGINNLSALGKLTQLLNLSQDWMNTLSTGEANYDRFLVKTRQLVCGTLVGMGIKRIGIEDVKFDWVIVDEAGRAQASELMVALQSARRVLLVGDHKQLPPLYDKSHISLAAEKAGCQRELFSVTDFERAFNANDGVSLDTQYRMVKPIGDIVSNCFYLDTIGELKTGRENSPEWYQKMPDPWSVPVTWLDSGFGTLDYGEQEIGKGKYINDREAQIIVSALERLCSTDIVSRLSETCTIEQSFPIGIITMYRSQLEHIDAIINQRESLAQLRNLIRIDTVDSYQGQENKIIMLSLVRDNPRSAQGFLGDAPRINVAISRAQERIMIAGASRMWTHENTDSALSSVHEYILQQVSTDEKNYQRITATDILGSEY